MIKNRIKSFARKGNIRIIKDNVVVGTELYKYSTYDTGYEIVERDITEVRFYVYKGSKLIKEYKSQGAATKLMNKLYREPEE